MHSRKISRGFMVLSLSAIFASPTGAFAVEPSPLPDTQVESQPGVPQKRKAANDKVIKLENERNELKARLKAIQKDPNASDAQIQAAQDLLDAKNSELNSAVGDVRSGKRKEAKVVRDETTVEKNTQKISDDVDYLKANQGKLSQEEIERVQQEIKDLRDDNARLNKRIGRKQKDYEKRVGEEMWVHCKADEMRNVKTNTCQTKCTAKEIVNADSGKCEAKCDPVAEVRNEVTRACDAKPKPKVASDAQKRGVAACWDETKTTEKKVYSLFDHGQADITLKADGNATTISEEDPLGDFFVKQVKGVADAIGPNGRISKLTVTSYTSKVQYSTKKKSRTPASLAHDRSKESVMNLYAELAFDNNLDKAHLTPVDLSYDEKFDDQTNGAVSIGPSWTPGEYGDLQKQKKVTDADLTAAAKRIIASKDPTPVKATGGTPEENLKKTKENLKQCCSANQAALRYQPYQFSEMTLSLPTYTPNAPECIKNADMIANSTGTKSVTPSAIGEHRSSGGGCVPDADNDCRERTTGAH